MSEVSENDRTYKATKGYPVSKDPSFCDASGHLLAIYTEAIDLAEIGPTVIRRASHVEPCVGGWSADMSPVYGPVLGPFVKRSEALAAEVYWLELNVL